MGLYEKLIEEKQPLSSEEEKCRQERARGERRMAAWISRKETENLPPDLGPYGYVTREELLEERGRYIRDLETLARLMVTGPRYKGLQNRYKQEYTELRNELLGYGNYQQTEFL